MGVGRVTKLNIRIVEVYDAMYRTTHEWCKKTASCKTTGYCCSWPGMVDACHMTKKFALDSWGVALPDVPEGGYSANGPCPVAPHLRPHCTDWLCDTSIVDDELNRLKVEATALHSEKMIAMGGGSGSI